MYTPYAPENLDRAKPDLVIIGNVIRRVNPEATAVRERGLRQMSFPTAFSSAARSAIPAPSAFFLWWFPVLPHATLVFLSKHAQTIQSVGEFLMLLIVAMFCETVLDSIQNRVPSFSDSVP